MAPAPLPRCSVVARGNDGPYFSCKVRSEEAILALPPSSVQAMKGDVQCWSHSPLARPKEREREVVPWERNSGCTSCFALWPSHRWKHSFYRVGAKGVEGRYSRGTVYLQTPWVSSTHPAVLFVAPALVPKPLYV